MKTIILFFGLTIYFTAFTLDYHQTDTYYNHLYEINKEWAYHKNACPKGQISFSSDKDRISLHLKLVCNELIKNPSKSLKQSTLNRRIKLILSLLDYANKKEFPTNFYFKNRQPYFIDYKGVHCAVGYLMQQSGDEELAQKIKQEHNYDYVKDIKTNGVFEWAQKNGFTVEELKWIQPAYPQNYFDSIYGGTNQSVNVLYKDNYSGNIILAGKFDSINNLPCLHIGAFHNEQFSCLGNGLSGTIEDVSITYNNNIMAVGTIINALDTFPYAVFDNGLWNYMSIPNRIGATSTACFFNGLRLEITCNHANNRQELWYYDNNTGWELMAEVDGEIYDIQASFLGRIYGGKFDTVFVYNNSIIVDTVLAKNVIIKDNYQPIWTNVGTALPDTVKTIEVVGSAVYFGGSCNATNNITLTKYLNNTLQPLLLYDNFYAPNGTVSIEKILFSNSSQTLKLAGNFLYPAFGLGAGSDFFMGYSLSHNLVYEQGWFNGIVKTMVYDNQVLYIGGEFTENQGFPLNHIARLGFDNLDIDEYSSNFNLKLFPNPCIDLINVSLSNPSIIENIIIYDAFGKEVYRQNNVKQSNVKINTDSFVKGVYSMIIINTDDKKTSSFFIKI